MRGENRNQGNNLGFGNLPSVIDELIDNGVGREVLVSL